MTAKRASRIGFALAGVLAGVAFVSALIAVWEPQDSYARHGWGGSAVICALAAFILSLVAAGLGEGDE